MLPKNGVVHKQSAVIPSDRIAMMAAANHFVALMLNKQLDQTSEDLSDIELRTYNGALEYLTRQFTIGHTDNETVPVTQYQEFKQ